MSHKAKLEKKLNNPSVSELISLKEDITQIKGLRDENEILALFQILEENIEKQNYFQFLFKEVFHDLTRLRRRK